MDQRNNSSIETKKQNIGIIIIRTIAIIPGENNTKNILRFK